jgi:glycerophosphoryl diester phosphodiesterase
VRPYLTGEHPIRFAHRGGAAIAPENTMAAFGGAYDLGIRYMETDVHLTADGVVVVFHDHELDRLTNGSGKVEEWRWDDLRLLDAGYSFEVDGEFPYRGKGERIPRLDEVMAEFPDTRWNIDMKHTPVVEALAHLIIEASAEDRVMAASFYDHRLRAFRRASGGRVATSTGPMELARLALAARLGRSARIEADALQIPKRVVSSRLVAAAHRADAQVHVWTIDDAPTMRGLLDIGVDGIMSDRPDVLVDVVAAWGA